MENANVDSNGENEKIQLHVLVPKLPRSLSSLPSSLHVFLFPAHQVPEHDQGYPGNYKNLTPLIRYVVGSRVE